MSRSHGPDRKPDLAYTAGRHRASALIKGGMAPRDVLAMGRMYCDPANGLDAFSEGWEAECFAADPKAGDPVPVAHEHGACSCAHDGLALPVALAVLVIIAGCLGFSAAVLNVLHP